MPFVYIPDSIEPTLVNADAADYKVYPREHAYLYDEPRFDRSRHRAPYPHSYAPPNPYSGSYRDQSPHLYPYSRAHVHPHSGRHHTRPHAPPRPHLAYPYESFQEYERPYTEVDHYAPSAYHNAIKAARQRAEYEAEALAAARAELAAEKVLRERARAEQLAKAKRAAAIEAYLVQEAARKEEKERQRMIGKERKRYEAAKAVARETIIREEKERALAEARNRQSEKFFQQALQSASQKRSALFHDRAVSKQAESDLIQHLLQITGLNQSQLQSRSSANLRAKCQSEFEAGQSACRRKQANDNKEHEAEMLARLMCPQQQPACSAAKQEATQPAQSRPTTAQSAAPIQPATQHKAPEQAEIDPLQFLLHLVEAVSGKKDEPAPDASFEPKASTAASTVPVWHWIPHPSAQNSPVVSTSEPKPRINPSSVLTATHKASSETPVAPASTSSAPSPSLSQSSSSRLRLSTLDNRLSSLVDRPNDKALNRSELEHELTRLLLEADEIESDGDENLRGDRKQFVVRVERVLDTLDVDQKQPQSQPQEKAVEGKNDEIADKDEDSLEPTSAPNTNLVPEPLLDSTPTTQSTDDVVESSEVLSELEKEVDLVSADYSSIQPQTSDKVKSDDLAEETPAVIPFTDATSTTSLLGSTAALPSDPVAATKDVESTNDAVSDVSSEASSPPSSPVVTASQGVQRRGSAGSNPSSSSSIRRGRKAYVEDAVEGGEDEFQLV